MKSKGFAAAYEDLYFLVWTPEAGKLIGYKMSILRLAGLVRLMGKEACILQSSSIRFVVEFIP
jgi:hypothetical protein